MLTKCKTCGWIVSSEAQACPHCGAPTPAAKMDKALEDMSAAGTGLLGCGCLLLIIAALFFLIMGSR